jgi:peroxiredoxin-like protein
MQFKPRLYKFSTSLAWTEGKKGLLSSAGKRPVEIACPPEFGGPGGFWSPEDLLVASVEVCVMTTFVHLMGRRRTEFVSYSSSAEGMAGLEDGEFRFTRIAVRARVDVSRSDDVPVAIRCIESAARECMVSRSLRCPVHVEHTVRVQAGAPTAG